MKRKTTPFLLVMLSLLLGGCLYPDEKLMQNATPYEDQLQSVQSAVDRFQADEGGILPIKTRDSETDLYQKYPVDFQKISPRYMAEPPGNAYESGGIYQYVIVQAETDPAVKLIDLRIAEQIRSVNIRLIAHDYPPFEKELAPNVYTISFEKLGYKEDPHVTSPYSGKQLPLLMSGDGTLYIDYSADLYEALQKAETLPPPGTDIRDLLVQSSPFVPAYSLPYTVDEKGNPMFLSGEKAQ